MKKFIVRILWAAILPVAAFAQNVTVQKTQHAASPADTVVSSSLLLNVPTGGIWQTTGSGQIIATSLSGGASVPWAILTAIPSPTVTDSGDVSGSLTLLASGAASFAQTVRGLNGVLLSGLSTGLIYNTTATGVPAIASLSSGSIVLSGANLTLSGDSAVPGNSYHYGTNGSGTKGWLQDSLTGVTSITGTGNEIAASAATGAVVLSLVGPHAYTTQTANAILTGNGSSPLQSSNWNLSSGTLTSPGSNTITDRSGSWAFSGMLGIGVGTTAPVANLQVVDTGTSNPRGIFDDQYNTGTNSAQFNLRKFRGSFATPTTIITGDVLGRILAWGYDGTNPIESGNLRFVSGGTIATNRVPSQAEIWTSTDAAPSVLTKAVTWDAAQNETVVGKINASNFAANNGGVAVNGGFVVTGGFTVTLNGTGPTNVTLPTSGTLLAGTVGIGNGGTGQTTANTALNALLPTQTSHNGTVLTTDGTNTSWQAASGTGTVTTVSVVTANGVSGSVANPTTTPAITVSLGAITPTSVSSPSGNLPILAATTNDYVNLGTLASTIPSAQGGHPQAVVTSATTSDSDLAALWYDDQKINKFYTSIAHGDATGGTQASWFYLGGVVPGNPGLDFFRATCNSGTSIDQIMVGVGNMGSNLANAEQILSTGIYFTTTGVSDHTRFVPGTNASYFTALTSGAIAAGTNSAANLTTYSLGFNFQSSVAKASGSQNLAFFGTSDASHPLGIVFETVGSNIVAISGTEIGSAANAMFLQHGATAARVTIGNTSILTSTLGLSSTEQVPKISANGNVLLGDTYNGSAWTGTRAAMVLVEGSHKLEAYTVASGNTVAIGPTTAGDSFQLFGGGTTGLTINSNQSITMAHYGAGAATFDSSGNITSVSDARFKNIDRPFFRGLEAIRKLDPQVFHWNAKSGLNQSDVNAGFVAQNVREAIPEAVGQNKDGYLTLADRPITAALVNAVKELDQRPTKPSPDWTSRAIGLAALLLAIRANLKKKIA